MNRSISKRAYGNLYWDFLSHWYNLFNDFIVQSVSFGFTFIAQFNNMETIKFFQQDDRSAEDSVAYYFQMYIYCLIL